MEVATLSTPNVSKCHLGHEVGEISGVQKNWTECQSVKIPAGIQNSVVGFGRETNTVGNSS
jgi:hypothetical protein